MTFEEFLYLGRVDLFQYQRWGANFFLGVLGAVYLLLRRRRGDTLRECGLLAFITAVCFTFPGISWLVQHLTGMPIGHSTFDILPNVMLAAEAAAAIIEHEKNETMKRRVALVAFLLFLIPAGISIGDKPTTSNITLHKSLSGVSEQTAMVCDSLRTLYGGDVYAVLPRELQMEAEIADTGVSCPVYDWRIEPIEVSNYVVAARENNAHIIVIPSEVADVNPPVLTSNGYNIVQWLGEYQIWADAQAGSDN
ncbi:hypothetical protein SAMN02910301_0451 [Lachnospiraceae bacterium XBD2001]|nr:hypothetical protein SAMN02910301_0451 [Lachnospiraceae bacterium XBD2001]